MFSKIKTALLESPNVSNQPALHSKKFKQFGKKLYVLIAAVIAVAVIVGALLIPQGAASIPLNVNYTVGEKMVYTTTTSLVLNVNNSTFPSDEGLTSNNMTISGKETLEVLSFDGEFYTLNNTVTMTEENLPFSYSTTEKMNKTGYSVLFVNLGNTSEEIPDNSLTSNQYLAQLLSKPEVKVGDTITIPYPSLPSNISSNIQVTGDLTLTFKGFQDLTVPAGTYKVFRVDLTSNNLSMTIKPSLPSFRNSSAPTPTTITLNMDLNYQMYLEYGSMRQIESSMQETAGFQSTTLNYTLSTTTNMTLNQDITS
jgi:hypothetical protein